MKTLKKFSKRLIARTMIVLTFIFVMISSALFSQEKETVITIIAIGDGQYSDISYQSIKESQIVDFSNLLRVYINKASVVMVDNSPVAFDETGENIQKILETHVENKYGDITPETIGKAEGGMKLLVRKSVFTSKSDFKALMEMVNNSIWKLQQNFSNKIYNLDFNSLNPDQKDNIIKLVPIDNYLADDVKI
jgi:hypothetical protein